MIFLWGRRSNLNKNYYLYVKMSKITSTCNRKPCLNLTMLLWMCCCLTEYILLKRKKWISINDMLLSNQISTIAFSWNHHINWINNNHYFAAILNDDISVQIVKILIFFIENSPEDFSWEKGILNHTYLLSFVRNYTCTGF